MSNGRIGDISRELDMQRVIPMVESPKDGGIIEIPINQIRSFSNHPFRVIDDSAMDTLKESIRLQGIMTPVVVRRLNRGGYELISGHRRIHVARQLNMSRAPAIIKEYTDDEAIIAMVDSNLQRELLPSEKAKAFKMKMDAIKHQGTSRRNVEKLESSAESIGMMAGLSGRQVQRYIRLTGLTKNMMNLVDNNTISIEQGGLIAELSVPTQEMLNDYIGAGYKVSNDLLHKLLKQEQAGLDILQIFNEVDEKKPSPRVRVNISKRIINQYIPATWTNHEIEVLIEQLLDEWSKNNK